MSERHTSPDDMRLPLEEARARIPAHPSPIEAIFYGNQGRLASKWLHYLPIYEQLFSPRRGAAVRLLEIGVQYGGSLELWRQYFGPDAVIYGVDIEPACASRCDPPNQVRIGSQADAAFLTSVVDEMGGLDLVLDDGSHVASHQRATFETLWPLLAVGGVYVIEDLHTSYMEPWEGGFRHPGTAVEMVKGLIDDMHGWFTGRPPEWAPRDEIGPILIADSIVGIQKVSRKRPGYVYTGRPRAGDKID
jgi:hypothetical protein